jgi:phosphatidylglycerophosphate synthase
MRWPKWGLAGLVALAFVAFWMLLAGPDKVLGVDLGGFGIGLAALVAWSAIHGISVAPRGELDETVSPGEWRAWIGLAFSLLVGAYLFAKSDVIASVADYRDLGKIGRNVVLLVVAWAVVSQVLEWRWKDKVLEDERDREIAVRAANWGRYATVIAVLGIAVMLGLSPAAKLAWASHIVIAHLLVFALVWGSVMEYAVTALSHWRDRRA